MIWYEQGKKSVLGCHKKMTAQYFKLIYRKTTTEVVKIYFIETALLKIKLSTPAFFWGKIEKDVMLS